MCAQTSGVNPVGMDLRKRIGKKIKNKDNTSSQSGCDAEGIYCPLLVPIAYCSIGYRHAQKSG